METILLHKSLEVISGEFALVIGINARKSIMDIERWQSCTPPFDQLYFLVDMEMHFESLEE